MSYKPQDQQKLVDKFNNRFKIGNQIKVRRDDDSIETWTVKREATLLGGHTAVIWCDDYPSCYSAERVIF